MSVTPTERLASLGLALPQPRAPAGNYVPAIVAGDLVFSAGQGSSAPDGGAIRGVIGADLTVQDGYEAARMCVLNCLAAITTVTGSIDGIDQIIFVRGFVRSTAGFDQQPMVMNGASDLLVELFGESGRHARTSIGVGDLPLGYAVEVELVVKVKHTQGSAE